MSVSTEGQKSGWEQVAMAIENVRRRLLRAAAALDNAGIPYAVVGGNAVAEWVGRVDASAVRFTQDVDLLVRRSDLPAIVEAMRKAGFVHQKVLEVDLFLDGPDARPRDSVHVVFAGEKVRADYVVPAPNVEESDRGEQFSVISLEALLRMKLTSFRDQDRTHLRDMLEVGLIGPTWCDCLTSELASRLQELIDTPEG